MRNATSYSKRVMKWFTATLYLRAYEQLGIEEVPVIDKKTLREFYTKNK